MHAPQRLRLGYFSADFRDHPVAQLLVELLETHDRDRFEVLAFSFRPPDTSLLGRRIVEAFDQFIDVSAKNDAELISLTRECQLDIAIDLSGHTGGSRGRLFAQRIAPVQVSYLGYPGTVGANYMDYLVADPVVCPPGSETWYSEKLARLPHSYMPHDSQQTISDRTPARAEFDLPESSIVFCCFNNHQKITQAVFGIWMRLLQQVEHSVLWLTDGPDLMKQNLRLEASKRGVDPVRLVFARRVEAMADHLARYRLADLFLDTWPYNAQTTACDALWSGVPVLTCAGNSFASRVAASLLSAAGLPELITSTPAAYEALALELARNPSRLLAHRDKLETQKSSAPLFDTARLTHNLERLYSAMHQRASEGLPPEHITLAD